jgi:hypothetical protein
MRHIKTFSLFESVQILTPEQKNFLDKYTKGGSWSLNPSTGLVDLQGNFDCAREGLNDLLGIRFGKAPFKFYCNGNNLKSLVGAPQTVGGDFSCNENKLMSLEGAPQTVGGSFFCLINKLTSLAGAPGTVGGGFNCSDNNLKSLVGAPQTVGGGFYCVNNNLKSLVGAPQTVEGSFSCVNNKLTSLVGSPQIVGGEFGCEGNELTSLDGAPQTVGGGFSCYNNSSLTSLAGAPETVKGRFSSDSLKIPKGKWSIGTLMDIFFTGTPNQQQLVAPLVDPKVIQQQIDENPEGMLIKLKDVLKHPQFQELKWPERLEQEKGLLSDLGDVGL